jgi:membrane-bound inhibitor of C-type lysozyme
VLDETHPDMTVQLANLSRERKRMEEIARLRAEQFEHGTSVIFAYECDEANSEFEMQCEKLRQEMLEEIHNEMEIINDQRKGAAASGKGYSRCEYLWHND